MSGNIQKSFKRKAKRRMHILVLTLLIGKRINWNQNQKNIHLTKNNNIIINQVWARQFSKKIQKKAYAYAYAYAYSGFKPC